jgi:hypothetical protein
MQPAKLDSAVLSLPLPANKKLRCHIEFATDSNLRGCRLEMIGFYLCLRNSGIGLICVRSGKIL